MINPQSVAKLVDYVNDEEFDTESLDVDLKINGNISKSIRLCIGDTLDVMSLCLNGRMLIRNCWTERWYRLVIDIAIIVNCCCNLN